MTKGAFLWGAASASYQVEGAWQADGKGLSNWDVYTNRYRLTEAVVGVQQTGNVAINAYDRTQYLADIRLMQEVGIDAYRFSLSWPRIFPDGVGAVNEAGLDHYKRFIDDLGEAGIAPIVTLYHWDYPWALHEQGGWRNPQSVRWFRNYAATVFRAFHDRVRTFITFNEPFIDLFLMELAAENVRNKRPDPVRASNAQYGEAARAMHHLFLANALAVNDFRRSGQKGEIGIALPLMPTFPVDPASADDVAAAALADALINRWPLDAVFKGSYPDEVVKALQRHNPDFMPADTDFEVLKASPVHFLGINYYAPAFVRADAAFPLGFRWMDTNPDTVKMFNGPVRPDQLHALLLRIDRDYGHPPILITENGAGFGETDEVMEGGVVKDPLRTDYIRRHIAAVEKAMGDGVDMRGYILWSLFDNFEWLQGYTRRFGLVHVDFETQARTRKQSFFAYRDIVAASHGSRRSAA